MKGIKIKTIVLILLAVLVLVGCIFAVSMFMEYSSTGQGDGEAVTIDVKQGEGTLDIASKLKEKNVPFRKCSA